MRRLDAGGVDAVLRKRWSPTADGVDEVTRARLSRDRREIVPWLNKVRGLDGAKILEIGCGRGASTLALAEQGAVVTGVDLDADLLVQAEKLLRSAGLPGTFHCLNAAHLGELSGESFDFVIFWASLEHMTVMERLEALSNGWRLVGRSGYLAVIETPNRLWPHDSHTSQLPYFSWLPDDLAFHYSRYSNRRGFGGVYGDVDEQMLHFLRRGRGVSFHEFDLAIDDVLVVESCLQLDRRHWNARGAAWTLSSSGRMERMLRNLAPDRHRAWFQPFLYLVLRKAG